VHGAEGNVIYDMVNEHFDFGRTGFSFVAEVFLLTNGILPNQEKCNRLANLALEILENSWTEMLNFQGSVGDFFIQKYFRTLKEEEIYHDIPLMLKYQIMDYYEKEMCIWNASETWFDISSNLHASMGGNAGSQYLTWGRHGYKAVFDFITVS